MASSNAFSIGTERVIAAASAPSASTHAAPGLTPASARTSASRTPVHSAQLTCPWVSCTVQFASIFSVLYSGVLPEHSRKCSRDTEGKRARSSMPKLSGRSTIPCTSSLWRAGSIAGVPAWLRTWCRPFGVMMPAKSCSGACADAVVMNGDRSRTRRTTERSNAEGLP